jgi:hypothetical protein
MRLWLPTLVPLAMLLADSPDWTAQLPWQGSLRGAWKVITMSLSSSDRTTTTDSPQPALVLFTDKHYSIMYVEGDQPRKAFADPLRPTDAEKLEAYDTFVGHSGSYTVTDSLISMQVVISKSPNLMGSDLGRTFMRFAHEFKGDTLRLTRWSPRGAFTMILVRAE